MRRGKDGWMESIGSSLCPPRLCIRCRWNNVYLYQTQILSAEFLLLNIHGGEKAYQTRRQVGKGGQKSETSKH